MSIVLLQAASGVDIDGPTVRVPPGNYKIEKSGVYEDCYMILNNSGRLLVNSHLILSNHSSIKLQASKAENLTVKFVRDR